MTASEGNRLARLKSYLDSDPCNHLLLADAVEAALDAGDIDAAEALNARLLDVLPAAFQGHYFAGVIAMRRSHFDVAANILERLLADHDFPNVRFNLAWSKAMLGDKAASLRLLDDQTADAIASAAMLRVQLVHEAGEFDEALALGQAALSQHPDDRGLLAAMATLALDVEDAALARQCALQAGDHPEAMAVIALLELQDGDPQSARKLFDRSLAIREHNPRAWIGRGLSSLVDHDPKQAAQDIDRGAQQFGDHIGSWIAAGWAHCLAGDIEAAHQRFERALAIDRNFSESHGSLAVIDVMRGNKDAARRKLATALRLDRECFSAALAQALLSSDDPAHAREIVDRAMNTPLNDQGLTIAAFMAGLSRPTIH